MRVVGDSVGVLLLLLLLLALKELLLILLLDDAAILKLHLLLLLLVEKHGLLLSSQLLLLMQWLAKVLYICCFRALESLLLGLCDRGLLLTRRCGPLRGMLNGADLRFGQ